MITAIFEDKEQSENFLQEFKNPFESNCVEAIRIYMTRDVWKDPSKIKYISTIDFRNENTEGRQRLEADSFIELVQKTETFIKSLE